MKQAMKKALAVLLAALMLLGVGGVAAEEALTDETATGVLVAPKTKITVKVGEHFDLTKLLEGTTWDMQDLVISSLSSHHPFFKGKSRTDYYIIRSGTGAITVRAPDGESITFEVTAKFTLWSWFKYYILFDWFNQKAEEDPSEAMMDLIVLFLSPLILVACLLVLPLYPFVVLEGWLLSLFK